MTCIRKAVVFSIVVYSICFSQPQSAIQFYDTSTGISTPTAKFGWMGDATNGNFFIKSNGSKQLKMNNNGDVSIDGNLFAGGSIGINNQNPQNKLEIGTQQPGTGNFQGNDIVFANQNGSSALCNNSGVSSWVSSNSIHLRPGLADTGLFISNNGSVGVGTVAPSSLNKLEVKGRMTSKTIEPALFLDNTNNQWALYNAPISGNGHRTAKGFELYEYGSGTCRIRMYFQPYFGSGSNEAIICSKVGISNSTTSYDASEMLDVDGNIKANGALVCTQGTACTSDRRFKQDIIPLDSSLDKIEKLQGVSFTWNKKAFPEKRFPDGKQIGLIAQDVEKIVPEVVHTDSSGYKSVVYEKLTALLIESVKEQQRQISEQNKLILQMKGQMDSMEKQIKNLAAK